MGFEDIKDQLREQFSNLWTRIQESGAYSTARERFDSLNPTGQKAVLFGIGLFATLIFFSIPYSYLSSASSHLDDYESKKALIRELFRVQRASSELPMIPLSPPASILVSKAQSNLQSNRIPTEQIKSVSEYDNATNTPSPIIAKGILQKGIKVELSQLNLTQLVDAGFVLQTLDQNLKIVGLDIQARKDNPHYFDVTYRLVAFTVPPIELPAPSKGGDKGKNDKGFGNKGGDKNSDKSADKNPSAKGDK